jgi:transposase, IS30 family
MSTHTKLTKDERIEIATFLKAGCSQTQIAYHLKKNKSTISREITRNKDPVTGEYKYSFAHNQAKERKATASTPTYQTIYNHIYLNLPDMKQYLRIIGVKGKYRRKHGTKIRELLREESKKKRIDTRSDIINTRSRIGDWEGDTIVGAEKTTHILTHVDRKSGYLIADKVEVATAEAIQTLTINSFNKLPKTKVKSITYDNGVQFSKHQDTEQKLNISIYFAFPYHSWERGTNENTNGLIRKYYPKKTPFKDIIQIDLDKTVKLINNRPRKRLNYLTPHEVFNKAAKVSEKNKEKKIS